MCKITIAIPVYNVEKQVKRSLLSALNQDFGDYEIIIIDDKGTDHSIDIVKEVVQSHEKGKIVSIIDHETNRGTGATKNTAIDNARGEYIYFMDSDDVISRDCLSKLYAKAVAYNVDIVAGSHVICDEDLKIRNRYCLYDIHRNGATLSDYCVAGNGLWTIYTWNKLYKLAFLRSNNIRCIPHHLCEDLFFTFQIKLHCTSFATCSDITYAYIENPNSLMGQGYNERLLIQIGEVMEKQKEYLINNKHWLKMKHNQLDVIYFCICAIISLEKSTLISEEQRLSFKKKYTDIVKEFILQCQDNERIMEAINAYSLNGDHTLLKKCAIKIAKEKINAHSFLEKVSHFVIRVRNKMFINLHINTKFIE